MKFDDQWRRLEAWALPASVLERIKPMSISGGGWGHGVGLSQVGAYGMAAEGKTASQILTHYFTGTKAEGDKVLS